jgi:hypothetical protein
MFAQASGKRQCQPEQRAGGKAAEGSKEALAQWAPKEQRREINDKDYRNI